MKLKDAPPGLYRVTRHDNLIKEVTHIIIPDNENIRLYLWVDGKPFAKIKGNPTFNAHDDTEVEPM